MFGVFLLGFPRCPAWQSWRRWSMLSVLVWRYRTVDGFGHKSGRRRMRPTSLAIGTVAARGCVGLALAASLGGCGLLAADEPDPAGKARELKNPVPYTADAVRKGRKTYLRLCQYCHGADGRAQANPDFEAPSLRDPAEWLHGTSDGEIFISIRDGAGHEMPAFGTQLNEAAIWELVLFVRSIGPARLRADTP